MKKVLYIDDDIDQLNLYQLAFTLRAKDKIELFVEHDARKAIERIRSIKPDLVLLDLVMRDFSGADVAAEVRKEADIKDTLIVAFSNSSTNSAVVSSLKGVGITNIWEKIEMIPKMVVERVLALLGEK
ncbi:MAG: response regulator [bacterium]|jgi:CheY-like chemotaxis protein